MVLAPAALLVVAVWLHRYTIEDAFIYYRVADNIAFGDGPVFNAGERVEATTSPLWTLILGAWRSVAGASMGPGLQAAITGTVLTGSAAALGTSATFLLVRRRRGGSTIPVPIGAIVLLGMPAMWYFGTSGLETSLSFAWIAACYWCLARRAVEQGDAGDRATNAGEVARVDRPRWILVLLGLGWIVRPELVLSSALFLGVWIGAQQGSTAQRLRAVGWAAVVPAAFQIFRMGYFGTLVPNTALAKSAATSDWSGGIAYVRDFVDFDRLVIPLLVCAVAIVWNALHIRSATRFDGATLAVPLVAGVVQGLYVIGHGGDFMHARLLIVPCFAMLLPAAVVVLPRGRVRRNVVTLGVAGFGVLVVAAWFIGTGARWGLIVPEPGYATTRFGMLRDPAGPDLLEATDFAESHGQRGEHVLVARAAAAEDRGLLIDAASADWLGDPVYLELPPGSGVVLVTGAIGAQSVAAGPDVQVVDLWSLSDPIGSRLEASADAPFFDPLVGKYQGGAWVRARYWPRDMTDAAAGRIQGVLATQCASVQCSRRGGAL